MKYGVQLYSLRETAGRDGAEEVLRRVSEAGYDGVEFAGFYGKTGSLYEALRAKQKDYAKRSAGGADTEQLSEQTWKLFQGIS